MKVRSATLLLAMASTLAFAPVVARAFQPAQPPKAKPQPDGPLGRWLRKAIGGMHTPAKEPPAPPEIEPARSQRVVRDHIDARVPHDVAHTQLLHTATAASEDGDWSTTIDLLRRLLDERNVWLVRPADGEWMTVETAVVQLLKRMPDAQRRAWESRFGAKADGELRDAQRSPVVLERIARRYAFTAAGDRAADRLATLLFDRGCFGAAASWYARLLEADASLTRSPRWRVKAAIALSRAGRLEQARGLLKTVKDAKLAGRSFDAAALLAKPVAQAASPLTDWPVLMGDAAHTALASGGDPVLSTRWRFPASQRQPVLEQIDAIVRGLREDRAAFIPTAQPIAVGGRIAFRTLRAVEVVDADTGRLEWTTEPGVSPEFLLSPASSASSYSSRPFIAPLRDESRAQRHPLGSLLFRDGVWGSIAGDERRLFVIEDLAVLSRQTPGYRHNSNPASRDPFRRNWATNRLAAYDLKTGRRLWQLGGRQRNEPFDLNLAGHFFFGAPVPSGDELLLVGEKDGEVHLAVVDRETGLPRWSTLLAVADAKIHLDLGRRWFPAQPAAGHGVIVCPTTLGWLAGVDRSTHRLLWLHRYAPVDDERRSSSSRDANLVQQAEVGLRWQPAAPVIAGHRVVYSPSEFIRPYAPAPLVCLDVYTGRRLWERRERNDLYLAGVWHERAIVVGMNRVVGLEMSTGRVLWSLPLGEAGPPSGRGVATSRGYYLPLASGEVWKIDLAKGKSIAAFAPGSRSSAERAAGNLLMYRGKLWSQSPRGLQAFDQRDSIREEIVRRKAADPRDAVALLREAGMQLADGDHAAALKSLKLIDEGKVNETMLPRYRGMLLAALSVVVEQHPRSHDREFTQLAALVRSPSERLTVARLRADRLLARGDRAGAFKAFLLVADAFDSHTLTARRDDPAVRVRTDRWVSGRLGDLYARLSSDEQQRIDEIIASRRTGLRTRDDHLRFARTFEFHQASAESLFKLAEAADLSIAESRLGSVVDGADRNTAARAALQLAERFADKQLPADARQWAQRGMARLDAASSDAELQRALRAIVEKPTPRVPPARWRAVAISRTSTGYDTRKEQSLEMHSEWAYFRDRRFIVDTSNRQLAVRDGRGRLEWLTPLRSAPRSEQGDDVVSRTAGHRLIVLHDDVVHCLSPIDRRTLWRYSLPRGDTVGDSARDVYRRPPEPLVAGDRLLSHHALVVEGEASGILAAVCGRYVAVHGRRRLIVLDGLTGETLWIRNDLPPGSTVIGTDAALFVVPSRYGPHANVPAMALRPLDGKPLKIDGVDGLVRDSIDVVGGDLILAEPATTRFFNFVRTRTVIRRYDPVAGRTVWKTQFPSGTRFTRDRRGRFFVLTSRPTPQLHVLDRDSGQLSKLLDVADDGLAKSTVFLLFDAERCYFMRRTSPQDRSRYELRSSPSIRIERIDAWDLKTGKRIWQAAAPKTHLVPQQFESSPVIVQANMQRTEYRGNVLWSLTIDALDKQTGRSLARRSFPVRGYDAVQNLAVDLARRYVEVQTYNQRFRIQAEADAGK